MAASLMATLFAGQVKAQGPVDNAAPQAQALQLTLDEDAIARGVLLATDADHDPLHFRLQQAPKHGVADVREDGSFTYTPNTNANGSDVFAFEVSDARGGVSRAEVTLTISAINDAPSVTLTAIGTVEDLVTTSQAVGTDVDGDPLHYRLASQPGLGTAVVDELTGAISYTPRANVHGLDAFDVEVSDGALTATASVAITVQPQNDGPVANAGAVSVDEDGSVSGAVVASDVDGDTLQYRLRAEPKLGRVTIDEGTGAFRYVANKNLNGQDVFSVEVKDPSGVKSRADITVAVVAQNDAPTIATTAIGIVEDTSGASQASAVDVDDDVLTFRLATEAAHGTASVNAKTGAITYAPRLNENGADAFDVEVSDGTVTARSTVAVTIQSQNDGPVANAGAVSVDEDGSVSGAVVASDVDGDTLQYRLRAEPKLGRVTIDEGTGAFSYVANKDQNGPDVFSVEVKDPSGVKSRADITVAVVAQNDAPTIATTAISIAEDSTGASQASAIDVDGDVLTFRLASEAARGTATINAKTGAITYAPRLNENGADAFDVEVSDGTVTARSTVAVTIQAQNDGPVANAGAVSVDEDGSVSGAVVASDVDGDTLQYRLRAEPKLGRVTIDEGTGAFSYVANKDQNGPDVFSVEVRDPSGVKSRADITVAVQPVNDAPTIAVEQLSTDEDTRVQGNASASDVDRDKLTFVVEEQPERGSVTIDPNTGRYTFTPAADDTGTRSFKVSVHDGTTSVSSAVQATIRRVSDPPRVQAQRVTTREDSVLQGSFDGVDPDGDPLTFRVLGSTTLGRLNLDNASTGAWSYTPAQDRHGSDELQWEVTDNTSTVRARLTIVVEPVNDAPSVEDIAVATKEDTAVEGRFIGADIDGDVLSYEVEAPTGATIVQLGEGRFRYTPPKDAQVAQQFAFRSFDGVARSPWGTARIAIDAVNDPPRQQNLALQTNEDEPIDGGLIALDVDGDALRYRITRPPTLGRVVIVDEATGRFTYTPRRDVYGDDRFQFEVSDGALTSGRGTVTVHMNPVDDAPRGTGQTVRVTLGGSLMGRLEGYDPEGDQVRFAIVSGPLKGSVKLIDAVKGEFFYQASRKLGRDVFTFSVSDGRQVSETVEVFVDVE